MKKAGKTLLTLLIILILIPLVLTGILTIHYLVTRTSSLGYMNRNYLLTIRTDSLAEMYSDVLEAEAAEAILSSLEMPDLFLAINEFKSRPVSRHPAIAMMLSFPGDIQVLEGGVPLIILDPGWRSIVTRHFPLLNTFYKLPGIDLNILQRDGRSYYEFVMSENSSAILLFEKNLILISTSIEPLQDCLENRRQGIGLENDPEALSQMSGFRNKLREKGKLVMFLNPRELIDFVMGTDNPLMERVKKEIAMERTAVASFSLEDARFSASGYMPVSFNTPLVKQFVEGTPGGTESLTRVAPQDTVLYTGFRFPSLLDAYALFLYLQEGRYDSLLETGERASRMFFGLTFRDALAWAGSEAGVFYLKGYPEPIAAIKIMDRQKWDFFLKKLVSSIVLNQEKETIIGEARISRIGLPPFLENLAGLFIKGLSEPYYVVEDDTLLLSMDPEGLAAVLQQIGQGKTLADSPQFTVLKKDIPQGAMMLTYFDLTESRPSFIKGNKLLSGVLQYYQRGILSIKADREYLALEMVGVPVRERKTSLFSGYPVPLDGGASEGPIALDTGGLPLLVWIDREGTLRTGDIKGRTRDRANIGGGHFLEPPEEGTIAVMTNNGEIRVYQPDLTMRLPYPIKVSSDTGFLPVFSGDRWYWASRSKRKITSYDIHKREMVDLPFTPEKPLLTPPLAAPEDQLIIYPRDLIGTLYLLDPSGEAVPDWRLETGGPSKTGPFALPGKESFRFGYLTQSGQFHIYDMMKNPEKGYPVTLPGSYVSRPLLSPPDSGDEAAVFRSREGNITLLSLKTGNPSSETVIPALHGEEGSALYYVDPKTGRRKIIFYGNGNYLIMTHESLTPVTGFPVRGYSRPIFFDQNSDGNPEMLTAGLDDQLYLYTIPQEALK